MSKLTMTDMVFTIVEKGGQFVCKGNDGKTLFHFKKKANKYILSKEEIEKLISDAFDIGTDANKMRYLPSKKEYINLII